MIYSDQDTIAAIATAMSDAGIGIIRVSGPDAISIVDNCYLNAHKEHDLMFHAAGTIQYGYFCDYREEIIDEIMISVMKAPHSYTREDVIEINSHGGMLVMNEILQTLTLLGCRIAQPGEFTKRAFLNGRIDLTKAEAVMDIISADSDFALKNSQRQLRGKVYDKIVTMRKEILYENAFIESALDDPENYDLNDYPQKLLNKVMMLSTDSKKLLDTSEEGKLRKDGIRTVIVGKHNSGKSSLLNILTGEERAIVTEIAGTTRDAIEETVRIDDIVLHVTDTAGIRDTQDQIEKIGVEKAKKYASEADMILYMIDSTRNLDGEDAAIVNMIAGKKTIILLNKSDLGEKSKVSENDILQIFRQESSCCNLCLNHRNLYSCIMNQNDVIPIIRTSMIDLNGIDLLKTAISELFLKGELVPKQEIYITNVRHKNALQRAYDSLLLVQKSIEQNMSEDFFAIDLMNAYQALGEIIGEDIGDDLVNEIFSKFCMGK